MYDRHTRETLLAPSSGESDGESWLVSYLDVLTLLITLFVLLLSLAGSGEAELDSMGGSSQGSPFSPSQAVAVAAGLSPLGSGLQPKHDGFQPRLQGLEIDGVSVDESDQGITLRIDNSLLFASGEASL